MPGDGVKLSSWFFRNPRAERCAVIMLHGFGGARAEVVGASPIFWKRGCDLLLYDSRGHLQEHARALSRSACTSARTCGWAIRWLAQSDEACRLGRDRVDRVVVRRRRRRSRRPPRCRASRSWWRTRPTRASRTSPACRPAGSSDPGRRSSSPARLKIAGIRASFDPGNVSSLRARSARARAPVLLIHSRQDAFTPYQHSQTIYAASDRARTRLVIPDAGRRRTPKSCT